VRHRCEPELFHDGLWLMVKAHVVAAKTIEMFSSALVPCDFRPSRAILLDDTTV